MHDCMPYDPIQGQGHETFKVRNSSIFNISSAIFNVSWQMTTDSETTEQYRTFVRSRFLISVLVFVSRDFELGRVSVQFMLLHLQARSAGTAEPYHADSGTRAQ